MDGYECYGILFCPKKKWCIATCHHRDEPRKHAQWDKPDIKEQILYDSTYMRGL